MKLISTTFFLFLLLTVKAQTIERSVISVVGGSVSADGYYLSYSVGEPVITPSPSQTLYNPFVFIPTMMTIGFQQPQVAKVGVRDNIYNWISAYPNPTSGLTYLDIHGDQFQVHSVRIINSLGQEVAVKPFVMINGSIELHLEKLPAGVYMIAVTDFYLKKTATTRIIKFNK